MSGSRPGRQEVALARTVPHMISSIPDLSRETALAVLTDAKADRLRGLRELDEHLAEHPDALISGDPQCPAAVVRVTRVLVAQGYHQAVEIRCAGCGRSEVELPVRALVGRICQACAVKAEPHPRCARCGRARRVNARRTEGGICAGCYAKDEHIMERCGQCGRNARPTTRSAAGEAICQGCYQAPRRPCIRCGTVAAVHANTAAGPVCARCYEMPRRLCGGCGQIRVITKRATAVNPDLCGNCRPGVEAVCVICARTRPCNRNSQGEMLCRTCRPRLLRICQRCGKSRPIQAEWPIGPVCQPCYEAVRSSPHRCAQCSALRPLIGEDSSGRGICGKCAGAPTDYSCRTCGQGGRHYADGRCARCVLDDRLRDLLTGPNGILSPTFGQVRDALGSAGNPKSLIRWCRRSPTARLLARMAEEDQPLSHDRLDELPQDLSLHYARQVLVNSGVLPERAEYLERIVPWIDKLLEGHPPHRTNLVRPYAMWAVLRRARRLATRRRYTEAAGHGARTRIRTALNFLVWLEARGQSLDSVGQADVDDWLSTGPTQRWVIRYFLAWAHGCNLTSRMTVPYRPKALTGAVLSESEHREQLSRCLLHEELPRDVRIAGALILLYALPLSRLVRLTTDRVTHRAGHTYLRLGQRSVVLPPRLAKLLDLHLRCLQKTTSELYSAVDSPNHWLFPGLMPGLALTASALGRKLTRNCINARPSRHSAMLALAADLPAPVLAELIDVDITTASRWSLYAARDWSSYVSQRADDMSARKLEE